jgi:hypothetical protein
MRARQIVTGVIVALLSVAGCTDVSGPDYMELDIVVDWPKLDEEGFVGFEYRFSGNCKLEDDWKINCETYARGPIPADWDGALRVRVACPLGEYTDYFKVSGYYEARVLPGQLGTHLCSGYIYPECKEDLQVLTVQESPGFQGEPPLDCSPPE